MRIALQRWEVVPTQLRTRHAPVGGPFRVLSKGSSRVEEAPGDGLYVVEEFEYPLKHDGRGAQARGIVRGEQCRMPGTQTAFSREISSLASNGVPLVALFGGGSSGGGE